MTCDGSSRFLKAPVGPAGSAGRLEAGDRMQWRCLFWSYD